MRISDVRYAAAIAGTLLVAGMPAAWADDEVLTDALEVEQPGAVAAAEQSVATGEPLVITPDNALSVGVRAYLDGNIGDALRGFEMAADQGSAIALWKLAKMYADGDGVAEDDHRAFRYFSQIADTHADDSPNSPFAGVYASAFVELGHYYMDGIGEDTVSQDPRRAVSLLNHAATYFGDADAQYHLARLYLNGETVERDPIMAARWLSLSAL